MRLVRRIVLIGFCLVVAGNTYAALNVTPGGTSTQLWNCLFPKPLPSGVTINSVTYTGYGAASGCYSNIPPINGIQPNDGLLMTSGQASLAIGPNNAAGSGYNNGAAGDATLATLIGGAITYDAAVLTISFTVDTSVHGISFDFVFGSDEYPEYVGSFNDVFGAFLDGTNISLDSTGKYISVNNNFFKIDNQDKHIDLQMDGFTPLLRSSALLTAGTHTLKLAIADAKDQVYDSDVFLSNFQFSCSDTGTHPVSEVILLNPDVDTNFVGTIDTLTANVKNVSGVPVVGRKVIFEILNGPHAGKKDSSITNSLGNALFIYTGTSAGLDTIVATMKDNSGLLVSSDNAHHFWKRAPSQLPIANAGPDQTRFASAACDAIVSLNGSGSTDPDGGSIVSYNWNGSFIGSPVNTTSPITSITLQTGVYEIILKVTNNKGNTDLDTTIIMVIDNTPPVTPILSPLHGECSVTADYPTTADNCTGNITGTTFDPLTYSTPGSYIINWTFTDGAGNSTTQTQAVVIADVTKPVPSLSTLPTLTGECSYTITTYPTAMDNCSATPITGVPSAINFTTQGIHTVTWTYTDAAGNSSTQTQAVVITDVTKPVPALSTLPTLTGECSYTITTYPTATDNCSATPITGVPSATNFSTQGSHTVTWTYTDAAGNSTTQTQAVVIADVTKPVPSLSTLPTLAGECSYTITTYPTATDNCSATPITGVPSATNFSTQGIHTVTWTYTDAAGNSSTQTQAVVIADVTKPVPSLSTLPTLTGECSYTITTYPTATDNCSATPITGVPSATNFTTQGIHTVTWTYTDAAGNSTTQTQAVVIADVTKPVPSLSTLPTLTGECSYTITTYPTATDNCSATPITGVPSATNFSTQGSHTVTWTYTDVAGNSTTQTQAVVIADVTKPVPSLSTLPTLAGECSYTITTYPTATDNCSAIPITGVPSATNFSTQGIHTVTWTYTDAAGNSTTQTQAVVIADVTKPVPALSTLPTLTGECSYTITTYPTATDNCSAIPITGVPSATNFTTQGTHTVTWTYTDVAGNSSTQTQAVIVQDVTSPVISVSADTTVYISAKQSSAFVLLKSATATDNCLSAPVVTAHRSDGKSLDSAYEAGVTTIWWKACDNVNNCDSAEQKITVCKNKLPVLATITDTIINERDSLGIHLTAVDPDGGTPKVFTTGLPAGAAVSDSGNGSGLFHWNTGCNDHGVYAVTVHASDGIDTVQQQFNITIRDVNFPPSFHVINDTTAPENQLFTLTVRSEDCDAGIPLMKLYGIPLGATFKDNGDGTGTFTWIPQCDQNGFYMLIFELTDGVNKVRDTMLLVIADVNCHDPEITLSEKNVVTGINLPVSIAIHVTDRDKTIPKLKVQDLPEGALFNVDGNGNAVLKWIPDKIGIFTPKIIAIDGADTTVQVDTTVTISVVSQNFSSPYFVHCKDTVINENQSLILTLSAIDPDGTIPVITAITLPDGATLIDNNDGNAKVAWLPGCASHGKHLLVARTTDGTFNDTISVFITVRDQNCPPVINPVHNKNIALNSTLRFTISATDPDEDGSVIILSAESNMPGYTFTTDGNGMGNILWTATAIGNFYATFYASDGFLTDTETVTISVNQSGSLIITASPKGTAIYADPSINASGMLLGTDSITWTGGVGTWWFRAEAPGYRPTVFTGTVKANSTSAIAVALKPTIPLMFTPPKEIKVGSGDTFTNDASIAFVDYDNDGIQDLSVVNGKTIKIYLGNDSASGLTYVSPGISISIPAGFDSVISHTYCNWNNDGKYECVLSFLNGRIVIAELDNETLSSVHELLSRPGETLYPAIVDFDRDNRKDLLVLSSGKGLFVYLNKDTDKYPAIDSVLSIVESAASTVLSGNPLFWDVDGNGWNDIVAMSGSDMKLFSSSGDSTLHNLVKVEDLNAGGQRIKNDITSTTLLTLPHNLPMLVVLRNGKLLAYRMRLSGDVTGDGIVNISDISRISKAWELTDEHVDWNPLFNLRLSAPGEHEEIDIKDISKAAKCWELQE